MPVVAKLRTASGHALSAQTPPGPHPTVALRYPAIHTRTWQRSAESGTHLGVSERQAATICVATLNLRHNADRWEERAPLLIEQFVTLEPDTIGLQEVHVPSNQAAWIVAHVNARIGQDSQPYSLYQTKKTDFARWRGRTSRGKMSAAANRSTWCGCREPPGL